MLGNLLSNMVEVSYIIGDKITGEVKSGEFKIDSGTAFRYANDDEAAEEKFKLSAIVDSQLPISCGYYGFYVSDEECKKHNLPNCEVSYDEFRKGFFKKFARYA